MKLFGKDYNLVPPNCTGGTEVPPDYVNIFVNITNICNCKCSFCIADCHKNKHTIDKFDFDKYSYIVKEIQKTIPIKKLSYTGGEVSLKPELLERCLLLPSRAEITVNTNGTERLDTILNMYDLIDSIPISRHHYLNEKNEEIFNKKFNFDLSDIDKKFHDKIHIRCNLMKGYIDSKAEVMNFLEYFSKIGFKDYGFVSLIQNNEYSKDKFIDFFDLGFDMSKEFTISSSLNDKGKCFCKNYIYIPKHLNNICTLYSRKELCPTAHRSNLLFDGQNLRLGFRGEIIL